MIAALLAMSTSTLARNTCRTQRLYPASLRRDLRLHLRCTHGARRRTLLGRPTSLHRSAGGLSLPQRSPRTAFIRAGLIIVGGIVQILITSAALRLMPELRKKTFSPFPDKARNFCTASAIYARPSLLFRRTSQSATPSASSSMLASTWAYLHRHPSPAIGSPLTTLLVQRPTFTRDAHPHHRSYRRHSRRARLCNLLIAHLAPSLIVLATVTTLRLLFHLRYHLRQLRSLHHLHHRLHRLPALPQPDSRHPHRPSARTVHHRRGPHSTRHSHRCPASLQIPHRHLKYPEIAGCSNVKKSTSQDHPALSSTARGSNEFLSP